MISTDGRRTWPGLERWSINFRRICPIPQHCRPCFGESGESPRNIDQLRANLSRAVSPDSQFQISPKQNACPWVRLRCYALVPKLENAAPALCETCSPPSRPKFGRTPTSLSEIRKICPKSLQIWSTPAQFWANRPKFGLTRLEVGGSRPTLLEITPNVVGFAPSLADFGPRFSALGAKARSNFGRCPRHGAA